MRQLSDSAPPPGTAASAPSPQGGGEQGAAPCHAADQPPLRVVGIPTRHDSAVRHVAGSALYVDDLRGPAGTLHMAVGGAPAARGRIRSIDIDAVKRAPGVVALRAPARIPGRDDVGPG